MASATMAPLVDDLAPYLIIAVMSQTFAAIHLAYSEVPDVGAEGQLVSW